MKKWINKFSALTLAAALITAPSAVVSADTGVSVIDYSNTGSITIYKYDITSASEDGAYTQGSITATGAYDETVITALSDYAIADVEFTYLRMGDVEQYALSDGTGTSVELVYEIPTDLAGILGLEDDAIDMSTASGVADPCNKTDVLHYTSDQINEALEEILTADNIEAKNALEEYVSSRVSTDPDDSSAAHAMDMTDENGYTSVSGLELGLYLVVETAVPSNVTDTTNPFFVSLPMTNLTDDAGKATGGTKWIYDVVVYPKNQTGSPTLDKLVSEDAGTNYAETVSASEGDLLDYILVSKLPHITSKATYLTRYSFTDILSCGLTYKENVQISLYSNADDASANNTANAIFTWNETDVSSDNSVYFTQTSSVADGITTVQIQLTATGLEVLNSTYSDYYLVVHYNAKLDSNAETILGDDGNDNNVTLTWKRTSVTDVAKDLTDESTVYTYGISLEKTFSDGNGDPTAVSFRLYNTTDACYLTATGNEGIYYITGTVAQESEASVFVPGSDGELMIYGLEADSYQLTELTTDDGYLLLADPVAITISYDDGTQTAAAEVDGKEAVMTASGDSFHALVLLSILNTSSFDLPQTGGAGLYVVTILGVALFTVGCRFAFGKKRLR